jgi:hypothetical protein
LKNTHLQDTQKKQHWHKSLVSITDSSQLI